MHRRWLITHNTALKAYCTVYLLYMYVIAETKGRACCTITGFARFTYMYKPYTFVDEILSCLFTTVYLNGRKSGTNVLSLWFIKVLRVFATCTLEKLVMIMYMHMPPPLVIVRMIL